MLQMKYKTKSKQLYVEVMRLRYQCSRSEQKKTTKYVPEVDTIEVCCLYQNTCSVNAFIFIFR